MGIAIEVYRTCREAVREHGPGRIERVSLAVGELSAVEPELLVFAWEAVTSGGPDAGSRLEIAWRPAQQYCEVCRQAKARAEGSWLRLCPDCGHPLAVEGGDELDVLELAYECEDGERGDGGEGR